MLNMKHRSHSRSRSSSRRAAATRANDQPYSGLQGAAINRPQAALRASHFRYHLSTAEVLSKDHAKRYAQLRSYASQRKARIILRVFPQHHC